MRVYLLLVLLILIFCVGGNKHRKTFTVSKRTAMRLSKRDTRPTGSCSCTCETKPVNNNHHDFNDLYIQDSSDAKHPIRDLVENNDMYVDELSNKKPGPGHQKRFPWEDMPDVNCYRQKCSNENDCCRSFNICDKSANTCIDCWHGMGCNTEADCCQRYRYCQRRKGDLGRCVAEIN